MLLRRSTKMPKQNASVSIVLPSYNEKDNIPEAIQRIEKALGKQLLEIIVVDDNSPDGTWKIVEDLHDEKCRVIRRMDERGLASALARGVAEAKGDYIVWMDCDLGLPPEDVPRLVNALKEYDVAIGSRYAPGGKDNRAKWRALASAAFNLYASVILGFTVRDYTSGFIAVKRNVIEQVPLSTKGFGEYFADFAYRCVKKGFKVTEVGYVYSYRKHGESTLDRNVWRLMKFGWYYGTRIIKIRVSSKQ